MDIPRRVLTLWLKRVDNRWVVEKHRVIAGKTLPSTTRVDTREEKNFSGALFEVLDADANVLYQRTFMSSDTFGSEIFEEDGTIRSTSTTPDAPSALVSLPIIDGARSLRIIGDDFDEKGKPRGLVDDHIDLTDFLAR